MENQVEERPGEMERVGLEIGVHWREREGGSWVAEERSLGRPGRRWGSTGRGWAGRGEK